MKCIFANNLHPSNKMLSVYIMASSPLNHYNQKKETSGLNCDSLVASQVPLGRLSLSSLVHQRTGAAKAQPVHWANGAQSRLPNTSRRERMKAAWGTQTCMSGKASQGSQAHAVQSNTTSEVPQSSSEKSKKKKVKIVE